MTSLENLLLAPAWIDRLRSLTPVAIKQYYWAAWTLYGNLWFYLPLGAILVLEHLRPAMRSQRVFSRALAEDFIWLNLDTAFKVAALPAFIGVLRMGYDRVTGGLTLSLFQGWPAPLSIAVAFLIFDFLQWVHHWVRHRVLLFWHFHVIHHSQRELNPLTDLRVHWVEYFIAQTIVFVPLFLFGLLPTALMGVGLFMVWHTRLIHANLRTNFGPFRFILISPQAHRIHHSIEPRHQDKNFGVVLSIWDRLFGTLYPNADEYPETGVESVTFDPPRGLSPRAWVAGIAAEFAYPFKQLRARPRMPR